MKLIECSYSHIDTFKFVIEKKIYEIPAHSKEFSEMRERRKSRFTLFLFASWDDKLNCSK